MRAFTFTPTPGIFDKLQERFASPGEVFFGLLITQEPLRPQVENPTKADIRCKSVFRAMTQREYLTLLNALKERVELGKPDQGLFFVGKGANGIARGTGRTFAKKKLPIATGFSKFFVEGSMRPLGSAPAEARAKADDLFDGWEEDEPVSPYEAAAEGASAEYAAAAQGHTSPQAYAEAAHNGHQQYAAGQEQEQQYDHQAALARAQQIAYQSANQSMQGTNPAQPRTPNGDPLSPVNRAQMAHQIGLQSTYASMPNGDRIANQMGFGQPGQGAPQRRQPQKHFDADAIANNVIDELFG